MLVTEELVLVVQVVCLKSCSTLIFTVTSLWWPETADSVSLLYNYQEETANRQRSFLVFHFHTDMLE